MKKLILLAVCAMLAGCRTYKMPAPAVVGLKDSLTTKIIHVEYHDTVYITLPAQEKETITPQGYSYLSTDYAESEAEILEDGTLRHTLHNLDGVKHGVPVTSSVDSVIVEKVIEKPVPVEVSVPVECKLTWWERTRLDTWGWVAAALFLVVGWQCRRPIIALARRLI